MPTALPSIEPPDLSLPACGCLCSIVHQLLDQLPPFDNTVCSGAKTRDAELVERNRAELRALLDRAEGLLEKSA